MATEALLALGISPSTIGDLFKLKMDPFDKPDEFRDFKIIVEDKTFYVCPRHLSARSTYFKTLCNGQYAEAAKREAKLSDVTAKEFHNILVLTGADPTKINVKVHHSEFARFLALADMWDMPVLRNQCTQLLGDTYGSTCLTAEEAMQVLIATAKYKLNRNCHAIALEKMMPFGPHVMLDLKIHHQLPGDVLAALFLGYGTKLHREGEDAHESDGSENINYDCEVYECTKSANMCKLCGFAVCDNHAKYPCHRKRTMGPEIKLFYQNVALSHEDVLDDDKEE